MREYRQPWRRIDVGGRRLRLQILDPQTAFEVERTIIDALGDTLAFVASAPNELTAAVWRHATGNATGDVQELAADPIHGPRLAEVSMMALIEVLAECLAEVTFSPRVIGHLFRKLILARLDDGGEVIEDIRDYARLGLPPLAKWELIGAQIKQTYGPLWTRAPYRLKSHQHTYGVPNPKDVPLAVAWADNLAVRGSASSSLEILATWTPVHMIRVVENAAQTAEIERRAAEAARGGR